MSIKASTGLRTQLLGVNPFKTIFNLGFLKLYAGTPPASADDTLSGTTLLATISNNSTGTGVTFDAAVAGAISKAAAETWSGTAGASGTASFYRLVAAADTGAASTTEPRVQGLCAVSGADLDLSTATIVSGTGYPIDNYTITLPTL